MKNHKHTAFITIISFTVVFLSVLNYRNIDVLENRINTIAKYKGDQTKLDSEKNFKEDYYIIQQSHDTNVILVCFGLFVAISSFFTYQNISSRFDNKLDKMQTIIDNYKKDAYETNDDLGILKVSFFFDSAKLSLELAETHRAHKEPDNHLIYLVRAAMKQSNALKYIKKRSEGDDMNDSDLVVLNEKIKEINISIHKILSNVNGRIGEVTKLKIQSIKEIESDIEEIRLLNHPDINRIISDIQYQINKKVTT